MHGEAPRSYLTGVPGWESPAEQALLANYAKQVRPGGLIVEIGAEFGMSASLFAYAVDHLDPRPRIVSIDLFPGKLLDQHRANIAEAGYAVCTEQIKGDSAFVGNNWFDPVDLLFIDGDHSYKGVEADLNAWFNHVVEDGIIIFHDVAQPTNPNAHPQHFEVAAAIRDFFAENIGGIEEIDRVDTILVCRKISPTRIRVDGSAIEPTTHNV